MSQLSGSSQGGVDYNSTIIGALELSEKKWVLAVQLGRPRDAGPPKACSCRGHHRSF